MVEIARFADGTRCVYDDGRFDPWCVYLLFPTGGRYACKDADYFSGLLELANKYGREEIFRDFETLYNLTGKTLELRVLQFIRYQAYKYPWDRAQFEMIMTVLYAAMVAEENKAFAKLGKLIKYRGVHAILIEGLTPDEAACRDKGCCANDILLSCQKLGLRVTTSAQPATPVA